MTQRKAMHPTINPARIAGAVYLSMVVTGPFSLIYVPSKLIVRGNAAATGDNIVAHETLFNLAILANLVGQGIFICLAIALYRLLSGVNKTWAGLTVGFFNTLNNIAALILFRGADFLAVFNKPQRDAPGCYLFVCTVKGSLSMRSFGVCGSFLLGCWSSAPASCRASSASG
jgi:uncharacterized protein DUF4386